MRSAQRVRREWRVPQVDVQAAAELAEALGLKLTVAQILVSRGYRTVETVADFLQAGSKLIHDPLLFRSMPAAVHRLCAARERGEPVVIHGDYDVDGVTATALLLRYLRTNGWKVAAFLPRRLEEGYGVAVDTVRALANRGARLLITVDCGVTAHDAVTEARRLGIDVIVTDHHEPDPDRLPPALAVLNPHCDGYPFAGLCGCAVAYKLACALDRARPSPGVTADQYLDLVAVGTIGDVVPLHGENRALCIAGLRRMRDNANPGLRALCEVINTSLAQVDSGLVAYQIAPRINAAGRMNDPAVALDLLTTDDTENARRQALLLDQANRDRRRLEGEVLAQARVMLEQNPELGRMPVVVLAAEGWHRGVIGVVAARLVERLHRPVVVLAIEGDGVARGSARSVEGVNITELLRSCSDRLISCGGHEMAAGLALDADQISHLRAQLSAAAQQPGVAQPTPPLLRLDADLALEDIDDMLLDQLAALEPFGTGNPMPRFRTRALDLTGCVRVVGDNHLKIVPPRQERGICRLDIVFWRQGALADTTDWRAVDLAYELRRTCFRGETYPQLRLIDLRSSSSDPEYEVPPLVQHVRLNPKSASTGNTEPRRPQRALGPVTVYDARSETLSLSELGVPPQRRVPLVLLMDEVSDAAPLLPDLRRYYGAERVTESASYTDPVADWTDGRYDCLITTVDVLRTALDDPLLSDKKRRDPGMLLAVATAPPQVALLPALAERCAWVVPKVAVRLCFTPALLDAERQRALELWPDRPVLARVFTVLQRNARDAQVDLLSLYRRLHQYRLARHQVETGLRIFEEVGLLTWNLSLQLATLLPCDRKRELTVSPFYRRCQTERGAVTSWYDRVSGAQAEALFDLLGFGTVDH